jgi:hypothetical protein
MKFKNITQKEIFQTQSGHLLYTMVSKNFLIFIRIEFFKRKHSINQTNLTVLINK